jgi:hypothetical protein
MCWRILLWILPLLGAREVCSAQAQGRGGQDAGELSSHKSTVQEVVLSVGVSVRISSKDERLPLHLLRCCVGASALLYSTPMTLHPITNTLCTCRLIILPIAPLLLGRESTWHPLALGGQSAILSPFGFVYCSLHGAA